MSDDPRFPIGRFERPATVTAADRAAFLDVISAAPARLREAVRGLNDDRLDTPYREGGWTVRQVVHHLPDSHMNAYVRFKLALTEDQPVIKPYEESLWAKLPEAASGPIEMSLALLESIHARWMASARSIPASSFERTYRHPESGLWTLGQQLALYAWHSKHHVAHITSLRSRKEWS